MEGEILALLWYSYEPLKCSTEIRVISLLPAPKFDSNLEIRLPHIDHTSMFVSNAHPSFYKSISYCWGELNFSHALMCDGQRTLSITANVYAMLRLFRRPHKIRYLWIDAICLNQQDDVEKQCSSGLMGNIFHEAEKVHV
ncbi:hypothetical protein P171DRAFT_73635 [Karstenula rhodostoma CBS 690.94]|uniref:Heterokaryon incompatibility domain-containing protein n=1 Tax=Karstenula rhodostoma CBS 690.94 TaxID=1392251 RepID=A0A9P4PDV0_9PLEO|nr:hypothetical protein P171DRAFT_73635 [Karstenula rhodostoma CBS 690.94]